MKNFYFMLIGAVLCCSSANAQSVATFEDLNLATDSYWDGSDDSKGFVSGDYMFVNNFTDWGGGYTSWDGFAYSTMTSTAYNTLSDQYNSCVGQGVDNSKTYAIVYYSSYNGTEPTAKINGDKAFEATGCYVTNAAYAYTSMSNGDAYSKKFDDSDWFLLSATGYKDSVKTATAEFYLAKDGKIVNDWQYFDLSALGTVDEIHFTLTSSDSGQWGMNTPAYFCMDNFGATNSATRLQSIDPEACNEKSYDLQGRRTDSLKGFVIKGGKICFVK